MTPAQDMPPPPPAIVQTVQADARIRLNTIGFLPAGPKRATIAASCGLFRVVRADDGVVVLEGRAGAPVRTARSDTDETVQVVDFSQLKAGGVYRLVIDGVGASGPFKVGNDVWNTPYECVTRAMYLWRCGTAVETTWNGVTYRQAPCHTQDGWLDYAGGGHEHRDGTGGWHDAGDYNKYVVNAGVSVGMMLKAWEHFPNRIGNDRLGIPESGNGVPDLLDEIRWELEWLFKMQLADGRVYHKLSALDFKYWGPPERDESPRYYVQPGTAAAADFVAMMAESSRAWRPYDAAFADRCLAAAKKSWAVLVREPRHVEPDQSAFKTGAYEAKDASRRMWAAVEMWETTGDPECLKAFEKAAAAGFSCTFTLSGPGWGEVQDLAFATYLNASRPGERDPKIVAKLTKSLLSRADGIVATSRKNGYGRPFGGGPESWFWGCNSTVVTQTFLLHLADRIRPDAAYRATAIAALDHLFGRNYHARSYVTGLGARPPLHPHDRRGEPAWPGYLVGGGWPDGRSWEDEMKNYRVNEIAINWNAALIYATAAFADPGSSGGSK